MPLKNELLRLFESRTQETAGGYAVCVEGVERRYRVDGERFLQEANGKGPCPTTPIYIMPPKL